MYSHILVPTDGSLLSTSAVERALAFARDAGAKVTLLIVTEPFHLFSMDPEQVSYSRETYERHVREDAAGILRRAAQRANALGVPCETVLTEHEQPYQAIIDTASAKSCDLIAMASHGRRGMEALLLGSETLKVLTHSRIPVLVYR
ncbi:universal stress protein [Rhodoligotrophos ferricapiens]|uniref:universal stress protein n=1 Tax=Rhodoligotrophos ferricapiens TaxID=3069264 RepID=UPI00315DFDFD